MNTVTKRIEMIFAQAVALQQSGRLRSTIYCQGSNVYILNQDRTVLIRFPLRDRELSCFQGPVSFNANDYDSDSFTEEKGRVVFRQKHGEYRRDKSCQAPDLSGKDVLRIFQEQMKQVSRDNGVSLNKDFLRCLDEDLSHVEFQGVKGQLVCRQRNIYSGTIITVTKDAPKSKVLFASKPVKDFPVIGLRTNDLLALFSFADSIQFCFSGKRIVLFENKDVRMPFTGVISRCVYDEIGVDHGR